MYALFDKLKQAPKQNDTITWTEQDEAKLQKIIEIIINADKRSQLLKLKPGTAPDAYPLLISTNTVIKKEFTVEAI